MRDGLVERKRREDTIYKEREKEREERPRHTKTVVERETGGRGRHKSGTERDEGR